MDSFSQAALGASVAGLCAPKGNRRKALLLGAALGTLPDLDVLIDYGNVVKNFTYHRGFSHSLLVLAPFSLVVWGLLYRFWSPVKQAPGRWLAAVSLALLTHPLLDAHTAYGTQLWWPMPLPPTSWSTLFIIDPLYTLPLVVGVMVALIKPSMAIAQQSLGWGLALSIAYIAWSWGAKALIDNDADDALRALQLEQAPRFSAPTAFNTLLWRVVVMTEDGYLEGFRSLVKQSGPMQFNYYPSATIDLALNDNMWETSRLKWFARGFVKADVLDGELIVSDLRMGWEPTYVFSFVVAKHGNPHWHRIEPQVMPISFTWIDLASVWERMWQGA